MHFYFNNIKTLKSTPEHGGDTLILWQMPCAWNLDALCHFPGILNIGNIG